MKDRQKVDLPPACSPSFHVALTLTSLWLSGSLTSSCSANININSVIMASRITSLPWYAFLFSFFLFPLPPNLPLCLSLPSSHSGQSGQRTDNHHYKRWTRRWECLIFISRGVILLPKKKSHLNIFTPDFKQHVCFTGTQGAASSCTLPRAHGLMRPHVILTNELQ